MNEAEENSAFGYVAWAVIGSDGTLIGLYSSREKAEMIHRAVERSDNGAHFIGKQVE